MYAKACRKPYSICKTNIYNRILRLCLKLDFFSIAALAVVFAGISKGGFGSGAAFAAAAILATSIEPGQAIGIMLPLLMLMDVTSLKP